MTPEKILSFWLDETNPKQWYAASKELDGIILREFYPTWVSIMDGKFGMWLTFPSGSLAYILVVDQFSRNMGKRQTPRLLTYRQRWAGWLTKTLPPTRQRKPV